MTLAMTPMEPAAPPVRQPMQFHDHTMISAMALADDYPTELRSLFMRRTARIWQAYLAAACDANTPAAQEAAALDYNIRATAVLKGIVAERSISPDPIYMPIL